MDGPVFRFLHECRTEQFRGGCELAIGRMRLGFKAHCV